MNPGFVSGTDFVAEINPCSNAVTIIASKTDDEDYRNQEAKNTLEKLEDDWLKIYPTLLSIGDAIILESNTIIDGMTLKLFDVQGKCIRSEKLNGIIQSSSATIRLDLPAGFYIVKAQSGTKVVTQKIIVQ